MENSNSTNLMPTSPPIPSIFRVCEKWKEKMDGWCHCVMIFGSNSFQSKDNPIEHPFSSHHRYHHWRRRRRRRRSSSSSGSGSGERNDLTVFFALYSVLWGMLWKHVMIAVFVIYLLISCRMLVVCLLMKIVVDGDTSWILYPHSAFFCYKMIMWNKHRHNTENKLINYRTRWRLLYIPSST